MVGWLRCHCPPDTGFEIRALAVWGRARYLSVTEAPHNTNFHTWMGKKQFCFFQTAETGNRTPDSGVKGSGANHYPRAPAHLHGVSKGFTNSMHLPTSLTLRNARKYYIICAVVLFSSSGTFFICFLMKQLIINSTETNGSNSYLVNFDFNGTLFSTWLLEMTKKDLWTNK